jgi:hypothetical protein
MQPPELKGLTKIHTAIRDDEQDHPTTLGKDVLH